MGKKPTLRDIAQVAHVSVATVSKALNDQAEVSARTKMQVRKVAQDLGYPIDYVPSTMRTWHSGMVGLLSVDIDGRPSMPILSGAERALGVRKHAVLLACSHGEHEIEESRIEQLMAHGIDGLIVVADNTEFRSPISRKLIGELPVVYAFGPSNDPSDCSVTCNNVQAGADAIRYLVGHGRRRIAVIAGLDHAKATQDRLKGAMNAFKEYGLAPCLPTRFGQWSQAWGRTAAELLLNDETGFDGLYCMSDRIAYGAIEVLRQHGVTVPDDILVIGHDDDPRFVESSLRIPSFNNSFETIGRMAAHYLLDAITGKPHHGITSVPCLLSIKQDSDDR